MAIELDPKRDGPQPVEVHLHNHVPISPPRDAVAQSIKEAIVAVAEDDWMPRRRRRRPRPRGRFGCFFARLVAILWEVVGLLLLGFLNVLVLSQGLVELAPKLFGAKMSSMPGFGFMAGYLMWNKVLVGHVIALGFFCVMAFAWKIVIKDLVLARGNDLIDEREWNVRNSRIFWRTACGVLMFCDAVLFYYGVTQSNLWGRSTPYFSALISTVMYLAIVAMYSFGCLYLWDWERSAEE